MQARIEHPERERREVGAGQVPSLVAGDAPGAAGIALGDHGFLLVVCHLARLDREHVMAGDIAHDRRPCGALPGAEGERVAEGVDRAGCMRCHGCSPYQAAGGRLARVRISTVLSIWNTSSSRWL